jgi:ribosome-associated protein
MSGISETHLIVGGGLKIPLDEIQLRASRSSGPGGQHANKTSSRIEASFDVLASESLTQVQRDRVVARRGGTVRAVSQDARSQLRNRELALLRLAEKLESALSVRRSRIRTRPSRTAKAKRVADKRAQGEKKATRRRPNDSD